MKINLKARYFASLIPYIAVFIGIYIVRNVWVAALGYHLGVVAVLWGDRRWSRGKASGIGNFTPIVAINLLIGICTGVLLYVLWPLLGVPGDLGERLRQLGLTSWFFFGIYYCAVNPVLEELFWRRYLETHSPFPAWNDALFAGYHILVLAQFMQWYWLVVSFVLLVFASWIWGYSVRFASGLRIIIISHLLADLGIIFTGYFRTLD